MNKRPMGPGAGPYSEATLEALEKEGFTEVGYEGTDLEGDGEASIFIWYSGQQAGKSYMIRVGLEAMEVTSIDRFNRFHIWEINEEVEATADAIDAQLSEGAKIHLNAYNDMEVLPVELTKEQVHSLVYRMRAWDSRKGGGDVNCSLLVMKNELGNVFILRD